MKTQQREAQKSPLADPPVPIEEPRGDRGEHGKTWAPPMGEQGISNRPGDAEANTADDEASPEDEDGPESWEDGDDIDPEDLEPDSAAR